MPGALLPAWSLSGSGVAVGTALVGDDAVGAGVGADGSAEQLARLHPHGVGAQVRVGPDDVLAEPLQHPEVGREIATPAAPVRPPRPAPPAAPGPVPTARVRVLTRCRMIWRRVLRRR